MIKGKELGGEQESNSNKCQKSFIQKNRDRILRNCSDKKHKKGNLSFQDECVFDACSTLTLVRHPTLQGRRRHGFPAKSQGEETKIVVSLYN